MFTVETYTDLLTNEHAERPNFKATVELICQDYVDIQNVMVKYIDDFDVDLAIGVQLDTVGLWIGQGRIVTIPIEGVYFSWDTNIAEGWDNGIWKGPNDIDNDIVVLTDDEYRALLKSKISANSWQGDIEGAYKNIDAYFGVNPGVTIKDNQNMSITVNIPIAGTTLLERQLLKNQYIITKSAGILALYNEF